MKKSEYKFEDNVLKGKLLWKSLNTSWNPRFKFIDPFSNEKLFINEILFWSVFNLKFASSIGKLLS